MEAARCLHALPALAHGHQRIFLCRHGETTSNAEGLLQGSGINSPLSPAGVQQAKRLGIALRRFPLGIVVSSALTRSIDTAAAILGAQPGPTTAPTPTAIEAFNEMAYGSMEGLRLQDVRAELGRLSKAWASGALTEAVGMVGTGGENPEQVRARGRQALRQVIDLGHDHAAIVAHSNFNKIMLAELTIGMGRMFEIEQSNCCINVLDVHRDTHEVTVQAINLDGGGTETEPSARI
jgi:broad specificity phosphatase PhoE